MTPKNLPTDCGLLDHAKDIHEWDKLTEVSCDFNFVPPKFAPVKVAKGMRLCVKERLTTPSIPSLAPCTHWPMNFKSRYR